MSPATGKRRAYGQHFLRDRAVITRIVETTFDEAAAAGCTSLLEIGPGKGAITDLIREKLRTPQARGGLERFTIVERDREFATRWAEYAGDHDGYDFRVEGADFLELPESQWLAPRLAVVSNLPYSAGTAILLRLAEHRAEIPVMVLMFQAEVARRLRATQGEKAWGSLSLWIQNEWDVTKLVHVPPGAFAPPPDVDSEVVVLKRRAEPRIAIDSPQSRKAWDSLLRATFAHRRKMLRSGIPAGNPCRKALDASGVDGTKRAEALSWEEWSRIHHALVNPS